MRKMFVYRVLVSCIVLVIAGASPLHIGLDDAALAHHISAHHLPVAEGPNVDTLQHTHSHDSGHDDHHVHHQHPHDSGSEDTHHCRISEHDHHQHRSHGDHHHADHQITSVRIDVGNTFTASYDSALYSLTQRNISEVPLSDVHLSARDRVASCIPLRGPPVA